MIVNSERAPPRHRTLDGLVPAVGLDVQTAYRRIMDGLIALMLWGIICYT